MNYEKTEALWQRCRNKDKGKPLGNQYNRFRKLGDGTFSFFQIGWGDKATQETELCQLTPDNITTFTAVEADLMYNRTFLQKYYGISLISNKKDTALLLDSGLIIRTCTQKVVYKKGMQLDQINKIIFAPPYKTLSIIREKTNEYTRMSKKFRQKTTALLRLLPERFKINDEIVNQGGLYNRLQIKYKTNFTKEQTHKLLWKHMANSSQSIPKELIIKIMALKLGFIRGESNHLLTDLVDLSTMEIKNEQIEPEKIHQYINSIRLDWLKANNGVETKTITQDQLL